MLIRPAINASKLVTNFNSVSNTQRVQEFLNATLITDKTIIEALNNLDKNLISAGLLPPGTGAGKIKALYPFVGGTATTHKFNFIDPQDTDAAFRLSFSGGWTHSATGALPNGANATANTYAKPSDIGLLNSIHLSYYSRTDTGRQAQVEMGVQTPYPAYLIFAFLGSGSDTWHALNRSESQTAPVYTTTTKLFIGSRINSTEENYFRDGVKTTVSVNSQAINNDKYIAISGYSTNNAPSFAAILFSSKECAFSSFGEGLTDTEAGDLNTAVNNFQTTLGRNV